MNDFEPGQVIYQHFYADDKVLGPYTVLDPVRTKKGKLRLRGPRGGYMTTWWIPDAYAPYYIEIKE